jgi:peptide/nickel transport system substrate-binding protein
MPKSQITSVKSVGLGVLALALLSAGPAYEAAAQTPKRGGTLIFGIGADPNTTSRAVSSSQTDGLIGCMQYQGLTDVNNVGQVLPLLAKAWTITPDGLTYTFELVKTNWQDGKPFTSEDVRYSLTEVNPKYMSLFGGASRSIESIDASVPERVVFHLKKPYGPFLLSMSCVQGGSILPAHVFKGTDVMKNPAITSQPVGLGPFLMAEWKRGDYIRMKRNPNYWEPGKPYLDEVIAKVLPQAASRTQALLSGEIDFLSNLNLPRSSNAAVAANPKLALKPAPSAPGHIIMYLNNRRKPLDDRRVRQALMMGMDRDYLTQIAYLGAGDAGTMPFTKNIKWAVNPDVDYRKMYPHDVARANALLDEVGLKRDANGMRFRMNIVFPTDEAEAPVAATAIKAMWLQIGVDLVIAPAERTVATNMMYNEFNFDSGIQSLSSFWDPAIGESPIFTTSGIGKVFSNAEGYSNPEVDALFEKGEQATGDAARAPFYQQIQAILARDLPVLTIHDTQQYIGISAAVRGYDSEGTNPSWRNAWLDQ